MTSLGRRRIWSELVPLGELCASPALPALAERGVALLAAVMPGQHEAALELVARARELGLEIGLWPLLEDARGRWLHPGNGQAFAAHVEELLEGWIGVGSPSTPWRSISSPPSPRCAACSTASSAPPARG
ncbi:MAG: hypothetical protein M5U28_08210 [Sandaracinaceae bacterium]|nr:hypothetical protein [Sandaracinaceae bacterium]